MTSISPPAAAPRPSVPAPGPSASTTGGEPARSPASVPLLRAAGAGGPAGALGTDAPPARVALVGERSSDVAAHQRIPLILEALRQRDGLPLDAYWIRTDEVEAEGQLAGFDAIWLVPSSPYASEAGALTAVRTAREKGIPYLGTCGGFQDAVLEFARSVCGFASATHAEIEPDAPDQVVVPLACSLRGHEGVVRITPGSLVERLIGADRTVERYYCSYGISPDHLGLLRSYGLRFTGVDEGGDVRIMELPGHPFFLGTLFQPELTSEAVRPHPVIRGFAQAAVARAASRRAATRRGTRASAPTAPISAAPISAAGR